MGAVGGRRGVAACLPDCQRLHACPVVHLRGSDDEGRPRHVPAGDRPRHEVGQPAEAQQAQRGVHEAAEEGDLRIVWGAQQQGRCRRQCSSMRSIAVGSGGAEPSRAEPSGASRPPTCTAAALFSACSAGSAGWLGSTLMPASKTVCRPADSSMEVRDTGPTACGGTATGTRGGCVEEARMGVCQHKAGPTAAGRQCSQHCTAPAVASCQTAKTRCRERWLHRARKRKAGRQGLRMKAPEAPPWPPPTAPPAGPTAAQEGGRMEWSAHYLCKLAESWPCISGSCGRQVGRQASLGHTRREPGPDVVSAQPGDAGQNTAQPVQPRVGLPLALKPELMGRGQGGLCDSQAGVACGGRGSELRKARRQQRAAAAAVAAVAAAAVANYILGPSIPQVQRPPQAHLR